MQSAVSNNAHIALYHLELIHQNQPLGDNLLN